MSSAQVIKASRPPALAEPSSNLHNIDQRVSRSVISARLAAVRAELDHLPSLCRVLGGAMRSNDFFIYALGLVDTRGFSPLHHAAAHGAAELVGLLFDVATVVHPQLEAVNLLAMIDRREFEHGFTPLHFGVMNCHHGAVNALLNHCGASVNLPDFDGRSPLHMAIQNRDTTMVQLLLDGGADPNQANIDGATPLHIAAALGETGLLTLLARAGGWVTAKDDEGEEPLFWAVREGGIAAVKVLMGLGSDYRECLNEDGETPIDICEGDDAMTNLLRFGVAEMDVDTPTPGTPMMEW